MARTRRLRNAAEETKAIKNLQEIRVLRRSRYFSTAARIGTVARISMGINGYDPQTAADLAKAALDSFKADERLTSMKIMELEEELMTLKDDLEIAQVRVEEATRQFGEVLVTLDEYQICVDPAKNLVPGYNEPLPLSIPLPRVPHGPADPSDSTEFLFDEDNYSETVGEGNLCELDEEVEGI